MERRDNKQYLIDNIVCCDSSHFCIHHTRCRPVLRLAVMMSLSFLCTARSRARIVSFITLLLLSALCLVDSSSFDLPSGIVSGAVADWLIYPISWPVELQSATSSLPCNELVRSSSSDSAEQPRSSTAPWRCECVQLTNGLISRMFLFGSSCGWATVDFYSHSAQQSLLRAVAPEALLTIDGELYPLGGLKQNDSSEFSYADRSQWSLALDPTAWTYKSHRTSQPEPVYKWTPGTRHSPADTVWPPAGLHLTVDLQPPTSAPESHQTLTIQLHYEMYQGIPCMGQWVTVVASNCTSPSSSSSSFSPLAAPAPARTVVIDAVTVASLAVNFEYSPLVFTPYLPDPPTVTSAILSRLYPFADQPHGVNISWDNDPHTEQTPGAMEPLLVANYTLGPAVALTPGSGQSFDSFHLFLLVTDTVEKERWGLSVRGTTRVLTPATMENPIFFHNTNASSAGIRAAVDDMAGVGFEMMILSFGSEFDLESGDQSYIEQMYDDIRYAASKGIEVGGYDLIIWTRDAGEQWNAVDPTSHATHGDACAASGWIDELTSLVTSFVAATGLAAVEMDGPYPGYLCASTNHTHHTGLADSVYQQTKYQGELFRTLRAMNVYIHQPDSYYFQGGAKNSMGYNENQFSLPRWTDLHVSRMTVFEDTYLKLPTQGWMFVPLTDYHAGGDAAAFDPMSQYLLEYEWALAQYMGAGVGACYRGYRLYDNAESRALVAKWVAFYKRHRAILISDLLHLRRPDMQDIDYVMHVNYRLHERALAMVFNPTMHTLNRVLVLPLYYAGMHSRAWVQEQDGSTGGRAEVYELDRLYNIYVNVTLQPRSITWFVITAPDGQAVNDLEPLSLPLPQFTDTD